MRNEAFMSLLQMNNMDDIYALVIVGWILGLIVLYVLIKSAVTSGTEKMHNQLRLQNNLKIEEMKRSGVPEETIKEAINKSLVNK